MALPSVSKSWQYNVNQRFVTSGSAATDCKNLLIALKRSFCEIPQNPWQVMLSSDGTSNAGAGDYWGTSIANLKWALATGNHSWIVLRQNALSLEMLIDLQHTDWTYLDESYWKVYLSFSAGFTGGTLSSRPTATDEINMGFAADTSWGFPYSNPGTFTAVLHYMQSSDGKCTRVATCVNNKTLCLFLFDEITNVLSPIRAAIAGMAMADGSAAQRAATYGLWNDAAAMVGRRDDTLAHIWMYAATEGYVSSAVGERLTVAPNEISGEWPLTPISLVCETVGIRGRVGLIQDLWFGSTSLAEGTTYPAAGGKTFAQFGHLVVPWNGTTPLVQ